MLKKFRPYLEELANYEQFATMTMTNDLSRILEHAKIHAQKEEESNPEITKVKNEINWLEQEKAKLVTTMNVLNDLFKHPITININDGELKYVHEHELYVPGQIDAIVLKIDTINEQIRALSVLLSMFKEHRKRTQEILDSESTKGP